MARVLTAAMLAAIRTGNLRPVLFYEGVFGSGTVRLFTGSGTLTWNGNTWTWSTDGQAPCTGDLAIALDVQRLMVLRFDGAAQGVRWLWVGHAGSDAPWRAFRRALVSSQQQAVGHHDAPAGRQPMDAPAP